MDPSDPARHRVLAVGELLWDLLPGGPRLGLGGAPFNVVAHIGRLGQQTAILTGVGNDPLGEGARNEAARLGIATTWIHVVEGLPTGTARVVLAADGSPTFSIQRPAAYDGWTLDGRGLDALVNSFPFDALVLGSLAQQVTRIREITTALVRARPAAVRLYDVNLRDGCWDIATVSALLELATIVKLSESEAVVLSAQFGIPTTGWPRFMTELAGRTGVRAVCLTRGDSGSLLLLDGSLVEATPPNVAVVDTVGAGDAFAAALLMGVLANAPAVDAVRRATALGALVAARSGAIPEWAPAELVELEAAVPEPQRLRTPGQLSVP